MTKRTEKGPEPAVKRCPFCGSDDISDGETLTADLGGNTYTQSECQECGALGPHGYLHHGEIDYGSVKAIAAWNRRVEGSAADLPAEPDDLDFLKKRSAYWHKHLTETLQLGGAERVIAYCVAMLANRDSADRYAALAQPVADLPAPEPQKWIGSIPAEESDEEFARQIAASESRESELREALVLCSALLALLRGRADGELHMSQEAVWRHFEQTDAAIDRALGKPA